MPSVLTQAEDQVYVDTFNDEESEMGFMIARDYEGEITTWHVSVGGGAKTSSAIRNLFPANCEKVIQLNASNKATMTSGEIVGLQTLSFLAATTGSYPTLEVQYSTDNSTWGTLNSYSQLVIIPGVSAQRISIDMTPYSSPLYIRFKASVGATSDAVYLDDISLTIRPADPASGCNCFSITL